jgi:hypothetical protein
MPSLGYLYDRPEAIAARTKPTNWSMALLVPEPIALPDDFDTDCGPVLDQDGTPACVAFSATAVRAWGQHVDVGQWQFDTPSATMAYAWLKNGHGDWPGDGAPDAEGSWPLAVWSMAKQVGIPNTSGMGSLIAAYYQLQGSAGTDEWIATQQSVIYAYGPVTVAYTWPSNWWTCPTTGLLPYPSGVVGGHQWIRKGWTTGPVGTIYSGRSPSGRYWRNRQSWGTYGATDRFGRTGEFLTPFELDGDYLAIGEVWKTIDVDEPTPGGDMVPAKDKLARMLSVPAGTQLYAIDTGAALVKLASASRLYSPFTYSTSQYAVIVTTGGMQQLVRVTKAGVALLATSALT